MVTRLRSIIDIARDEQRAADDAERARKRQEAMARRNEAERRGQPTARRPEPPDERRERIAQDVLRIRGTMGQAQDVLGQAQAIGTVGRFQEEQLAIRRRGGAQSLREERMIAARTPAEYEEFEAGPSLRKGITSLPGRALAGAGALAETPPARALAYPYEKTRDFLDSAIYEPTRQLTLALMDGKLTPEEKRAIVKATAENPLLRPVVRHYQSEEGRQRLAETERLEPETKLEKLLMALADISLEESALIVDPLNLIPILGFTRVDDFARAVRTIREAATSPAVRRMASRIETAIVKGEPGFAKLPGKPIPLPADRGGMEKLIARLNLDDFADEAKAFIRDYGLQAVGDEESLRLAIRRARRIAELTAERQVGTREIAEAVQYRGTTAETYTRGAREARAAGDEPLARSYEASARRFAEVERAAPTAAQRPPRVLEGDEARQQTRAIIGRLGRPGPGMAPAEANEAARLVRASPHLDAIGWDMVPTRGGTSHVSRVVVREIATGQEHVIGSLDDVRAVVDRLPAPGALGKPGKLPPVEAIPEPGPVPAGPERVLFRRTHRGPTRPEYTGGIEAVGEQTERQVAFQDLVDNELGLLPDESFEQALVRGHYGALATQGMRVDDAMRTWRTSARRAKFTAAEGPEMMRELAHRTTGGRERFLAAHPQYEGLFDDVADVLDATEQAKVLHFGERGEQFPLIPEYFPGLYDEVPAWATKTGQAGGKALPGKVAFFERHRYLYRTTDEALDGFSLAERPEIKKLLQQELKVEQNVPYWAQPHKKAEVAARNQRVEALEKILADDFFPGTRYVSDDPMEVAQRAALATEEMIQGDILFDRLKTASLIADGRRPPTGWRIPREIPAFQGKTIHATTGTMSDRQFARVRAALEDELDNLRSLTPETATEAKRINRQIRDLSQILESRRLPAPRTIRTGGWAVPDAVAKTLENYFAVGGRYKDVAAIAAHIATVPKRIKLLGTLFQHFDITLRGLTATVSSGGWRSGPRLVAESIGSVFSPAVRAGLTREWLENPRLRMVMEAVGAPKGGQSIGTRAVTKLSKDWTRRFPVLGDVPVPTKTAKAIQEQLNNLYSFASEGLFDGVYMANAKHVVLRWWDAYAANPRFAHWTDKQIAAAVGKDMHVLISTIPDWMSLASNPAARNFLRATFFSAAENEGLLRGTARLMTGLNKGIWAKYWLSYYTSVFLIAESVNKAVTGHWLTPEQLTPMRIDWSGRPKMNWQFLRPIYGYAPDGRPLYLDLLMQQDTALRWIGNPAQAAIDRASVPGQIIYRTVQNRQFSGVPVTSAKKEWRKWLDRAIYTAKQAGLPLSVEAGMEEGVEYGPLGGIMATLGINIVPGPYTTPELRDFLKEHDVDPDKGVRGLSDVRSVERTEFLRTHGDTEAAFLKYLEDSKKRGSDFADMSLKAHELRALDYAQQIGIDLEYWGLTSLDRQEWVRQRRDHGSQMVGAWDQWGRDFREILDGLPDDDAEANVMQEFIEDVYELATDPVTGVMDKEKSFEGRDRWLAEHGAEEVEVKGGRTLTKAQIIDDHVGVNLTSREQQYLDALPAMLPAWDFQDELWDTLQEAPGLQAKAKVSAFDIGRFDDAADLRRWLVTTKVKAKIKGGMDPIAAQEDAIEEADRAMRPVYEWRADAMAVFYAKPLGRRALRALVYWGYETAVREDLEDLLTE